MNRTMSPIPDLENLIYKCIKLKKKKIQMTKWQTLAHTQITYRAFLTMILFLWKIMYLVISE